MNENALYRVLRLLASVGVFEETTPHTFKNTLPSEMMRSGGPLYDLALWISEPKHFLVHAELMESVKTGKPVAEKVLGASIFEYFARDKEWSELFNKAMTSLSAMTIGAALEV